MGDDIGEELLELHPFVEFRNLCQVEMHDRFVKTQPDIVFLLVVDDGGVPTAQIVMHHLLGVLEALFGEPGFGKIDARPKDIPLVQEIDEQVLIQVHGLFNFLRAKVHQKIDTSTKGEKYL